MIDKNTLKKQKQQPTTSNNKKKNPEEGENFISRNWFPKVATL